MPIARPLFLKYHTQKHAWNNWQTYTYGPDILVSPIWRSGKVTHSLYLPAGDKWVDAWDRTQVYEGGKYVNVEAPIHKIPIFIRAGSGVNLGDLNALYEESLKIAAQRPDLEKLQEAEFAAE
jgi:alpha-glucosidase (family GH31 glycosyl hydrolase)